MHVLIILIVKNAVLINNSPSRRANCKAPGTSFTKRPNSVVGIEQPRSRLSHGMWYVALNLHECSSGHTRTMQWWLEEYKLQPQEGTPCASRCKIPRSIDVYMYTCSNRVTGMHAGMNAISMEIGGAVPPPHTARAHMYSDIALRLCKSDGGGEEENGGDRANKWSHIKVTGSCLDYCSFQHGPENERR